MSASIPTLSALRETKPQLLELAARYGIENIRVFGSVARGDADEESDIDLMVDFSRPLGLSFFDFKEELEQFLERKVDVVSINAVRNPLRRKYMLEHVVTL